MLALYENHPDFVIPETRLNEIRAFVERGLADFSISRLKTKMPWGISVPGDDAHVMYVWFDALVNYISAIGWPDDMETFTRWWPVVQFAGKDNLRQQAAMWQAMLLSAGIEPSRRIVIHGFLTSDGQKMSKSVGNVVDPMDIIREYGADALRYYLAREVSPFEDGDFTAERFKEVYNADLANGVGNLTARIMKMAISYDVRATDKTRAQTTDSIWKSGNTYLNAYRINEAIGEIWLGARLASGVDSIEMLNAYIQNEQPFKK